MAGYVEGLPEEAPVCVGCGGEGPYEYLGRHGRRNVLRCRACGLDLLVLEEDNDEREVTE